MSEPLAGFPLWHIAITAALSGAICLIALITWAKRAGSAPARDMLAQSLVVALSVAAWRLAANVPILNGDPVPLLSPNDLLCPVVTYVCLGVYAGLTPPADRSRWEHARALLTIISFLVNVITI